MDTQPIQKPKRMWIKTIMHWSSGSKKQETIMYIFQSNYLDSEHLHNLNICRMYLQAHCVWDILNTYGKAILKCSKTIRISEDRKIAWLVTEAPRIWWAVRASYITTHISPTRIPLDPRKSGHKNLLYD